MAETTEASSASGPQGAFSYYATRPTTEHDEVVKQGDYTLRAFLNFYRFRRLGGERRARKLGDKADGAPRTLKDVLPQEVIGQGVHFVTDHPPVRIFSIALVSLLVLFESAANAYFFSQNNPMGLLGGLFQAAAVSLANVAVAYFIIGFWGLRHVSVPLNGFHWPKKLWGFVAIIIGLLLVLLVNLSAAHFRNIQDLAASGLTPPDGGIAWTFLPGIAESCREILATDVGRDLAGAGVNALCRPLSLYSLDAYVLFALGMAIAALAAFEGRRSDSPFPGLSDAARAAEKARDDLSDALEDYYASYDEIVDEIKKTLKADGLPEDSFTAEDRTALYTALDARVAHYRNLLTTSATQLVDEFDVPAWLLVRLGVPGAHEAMAETEGRSGEETR